MGYMDVEMLRGKELNDYINETYEFVESTETVKDLEIKSLEILADFNKNPQDYRWTVKYGVIHKDDVRLKEKV